MTSPADDKSDSTDRRRSDGYENAFVGEYYDAVWIVRERADVDFYMGCAKVYGSPALELGCGTGRILLRLAEAGHRVCGLDLSPCSGVAVRNLPVCLSTFRNASSRWMAT